MGKVSPEFKSRFAKYRAKKKEDEVGYGNYLKKERERKRLARERLKSTMTDEQKNKIREQTRKRVQAWRLKKKEEKRQSRPIESPLKRLGSYSCTNTFFKAVSKARKSLPFSPRKKRAIVRQLAEENFCSNEIFKKNPRRVKFLSESTVKNIKDFYESDEISWAAPGKRDYISVKDPMTNKLIKRQKRYLLYTIDEAKCLFEKEFNISVSRSKFADLRPDHVILVSKTPHNVCLCTIHSNFIFLIDALKNFFEKGPFNHKEILNAACCDSNSEFCMTSECELCIYDVSVFLKKDLSNSEKIKYYQWEKVENNVLEKVSKESSLQEIVEIVNSKLKEFKLHTFVKTVQSRYFQRKKEALKPGEAVLQCDYAENYGLVHQDEIQAAHWNHPQVTIFTVCIWFNKEVKSYVVVSDDLSHSKDSSWVFLKSVVSNFKSNFYPKLNKIFIFSDNCAAQFKSRFTVRNFCELDSDLGVKGGVEWNFFAAGHGKGSVDAVGGQIKRNVWIRIKSRKDVINSAEDFANLAEKISKDVEVIYVQKEDVCETSNFLKTRWERAKEIKGIRNYHFFKKMDESHVLAGLTSLSELKKIQIVK